ncbi:MAG TPA: efflux RND transporter permease subunit, partial [Nitrospiria bacterium]
MNIAEFSVKNRVPVNLLLIVMIVGGIIGARLMSREVFPVVSIDRVAISTEYPGVSPEEIEQNLTIPIEKEIKGVRGIEHIESRSLEGLSLIEAELEPGRDLKTVAQDIRSKIERMRDLPPEAEDPVVLEIEFEAPVVQVGVGGPVGEDELRELADELDDRIGLIEGVASIAFSGYRDREIWVEVDPDRMYALGIGIGEVVQAVRERNLDLAGGSLKGPRQELLLRTVGEFQDIPEVEGMVVRKNPDGRHILLRDIGRAVLTFEEEKDFGRINGNRSITLNVTKTAAGDSISIMKEIDALVEKTRLGLPAGVEISLTQNSAMWIKSRLRTLYINGGIGFTLVCATLFVFLSWRMALWTAVGIPASFLGALAVMPFLDQSINMVTLFAMIVVLGLVVDDAIIVTENVYRHITLGHSPLKAAVLGTRQVLLPVTATVATTFAAFLPMLMMSGILGKFMKVIPIVVTLVLFMSLIEALLILPSHLADFAKPAPVRGKGEKRDGVWFIRMRRFYQRILARCLRHRYWFVLGIVLLTLGLVGVATLYQKFVLFGTKDVPGFFAMIEMPEGTKLDETGRFVAEVERRAGELPETDINAVVSFVGMQLDPATGRPSNGTHIGQVYVEMEDFDSPERRNGYLVLDEMREKVRGMTGYKSLRLEAIQGGPPVGAAIEMKVRGDDMDHLRELSDEIQAYLTSLPGVKDVRDDYSRGKKEIQFRVDPSRAGIYGLDSAAVARAVRASFFGETASQIRWEDETIDIIVKFAEPYRNDYRYLNQVRIAGPSGTLVPVKSVAAQSMFQGVNSIARKDHRRAITVFGEVDTDVITSREVTRLIENRFGDLSLRDPGYDLVFGGEAEEQRKSVGSLLRAYAIAILVIYMILGGLFKSFLQPFVVMFAVPFGIIGVIIGHFVMGQELSLLSMIGMVALSGVVVNDSLLLVDFINRAREKGENRWRSIIDSGRTRLRPILLTTLTTVLGLLALSFQTRGQAAFL